MPGSSTAFCTAPKLMLRNMGTDGTDLVTPAGRLHEKLDRRTLVVRGEIDHHLLAYGLALEGRRAFIEDIE
jgi:hypothetical protein